MKSDVKTEIPKRRLGKTGVDVSILGLGGKGALKPFGNEKQAVALISLALDLGINYMESSRAYAGSESYYGAALKGRRADVFLSSKSFARGRDGAGQHLKETLREMKTDYLDLWQVHDVTTEAEMNEIFAAGGAVEAFSEAKQKGLARFVGLAGCSDPVVTRRCLEMYDFDVVSVPVNPAEPAFKSFLEEVLAVAGAKDIGVIATKVFLGNRLDAPRKLLFNYAMTQPISTAVISCDTVEQLKENAEIAANFFTLKYREVQRLTELVAPYAKELVTYKS